jgi:hypothetical protein
MNKVGFLFDFNQSYDCKASNSSLQSQNWLKCLAISYDWSRKSASGLESAI